MWRLAQVVKSADDWGVLDGIGVPKAFPPSVQGADFLTSRKSSSAVATIVLAALVSR